MYLAEFFNENPRVAIAMSGGVDSTYLLAEAVRAGADVRAYFIKSVFQPEFEYNDAAFLSERIGAELVVISVDILYDEKVRANSSDRCYYCKKALFSVIIDAARRDGYLTVLDGTNASDNEGDRPGMRALRELGVRSPLREAGLTKDEIRRRSAQLGLETAAKPAYACLATRIPTGTAISVEALKKVEAVESGLFELGYTDFRVRVLGSAARIQMNEDQMRRAVAQRDKILEKAEPYFEDVFLDLKGR